MSFGGRLGDGRSGGVQREPRSRYAADCTDRRHIAYSRRRGAHGLTVLFRVIPLLCRKAGVAMADARGRITSHRARATIGSQLYNAKGPMTLFEL